MSPETSKKTAEEYPPKYQLSLAKMTPFRERHGQIILLIAEGLGNDQIAYKLGLSPQTIKNHITRIFGIVEEIFGSRPDDRMQLIAGLLIREIVILELIKPVDTPPQAP